MVTCLWYFLGGLFFIFLLTFSGIKSEVSAHQVQQSKVKLGILICSPSTSSTTIGETWHIDMQPFNKLHNHRWNLAHHYAVVQQAAKAKVKLDICIHGRNWIQPHQGCWQPDSCCSPKLFLTIKSVSKTQVLWMLEMALSWHFCGRYKKVKASLPCVSEI